MIRFTSATDTLHAADESLTTLTLVTIVLIIVMLLIAYRSITRAVIPLLGVLVALATARGVVSFLVGLHVLGISSFATNMVVALVLGVSTDYGIFYLGRYHEARQAGQDKETAYYTSVANTQHVIMASGLAISGATLCLSLTKLNYFRTLGPPCFVAMVVAVAAGAHPRPRPPDTRQQDQIPGRTEANQPDVAAAGHRYRPVAGSDHCGCRPGNPVVPS